MALSSEQQKKILARAKILKEGGPAALAMMQLLDAFEKRLEGIKGEQGEQGIAGPMGPVGPRGPAGAVGPMGAQGFDGKDGPVGPIGHEGPIGPPGPRGAQGERGERGYTGRDGVLPTGEELKRMIQSLGSAWLSADAIKDLPTVTRELPTLSIFGGGQGGGGARLEVVANGVSLGQDIRKIFFTGSGFSSGVRNADGVITLSFSGGGSGGHTIQDEGTPLTARSNLNFVGANVTVTDDAGNDATVVTISGSSYTDEQAQDAVGAMVDSTLVYVDATPLLTRAALTGAITAAQGSNTTALGSFTKAQLDAAVSDGNVLYVGDVTQYTDEMAQDAIGTILVDTATIDFTYDDATPQITADVKNGSITFAKMQAITDGVLLGASGGTTVEEITVGSSLSLATNTLNTIQDIRTTASPQFTGIELGHATDTTITRTGAGDIAIEGNAVYRAGGTDVALADGGTGTSLSDPNADRIMFWDDSAGVVKFGALADFTDEGSPASGDYVLIYGAEGDLRKANWSTLPGAGGGAPTTAQYITLALDGTLSAERVLVATNGLFATDGGANGNISIKSSFSRTFAFMGA